MDRRAEYVLTSVIVSKQNMTLLTGSRIEITLKSDDEHCKYLKGGRQSKYDSLVSGIKS